MCVFNVFKCVTSSSSPRIWLSTHTCLLVIPISQEMRQGTCHRPPWAGCHKFLGCDMRPSEVWWQSPESHHVGGGAGGRFGLKQVCDTKERASTEKEKKSKSASAMMQYMMAQRWSFQWVYQAHLHQVGNFCGLLPTWKAHVIFAWETGFWFNTVTTGFPSIAVPSYQHSVSWKSFKGSEWKESPKQSESRCPETRLPLPLGAGSVISLGSRVQGGWAVHHVPPTCQGHKRPVTHEMKKPWKCLSTGGLFLLIIKGKFLRPPDPWRRAASTVPVSPGFAASQRGAAHMLTVGWEVKPLKICKVKKNASEYVKLGTKISM